MKLQKDADWGEAPCGGLAMKQVMELRKWALSREEEIMGSKFFFFVLFFFSLLSGTVA